MASAILALVAIVSSLSRAWGLHPNILVATSNATCLPNYNWMNGTEQRNPCLTVAYVIGACVGDTWNQPALPSGSRYDGPSGNMVTPCYCSWSCYNLMMACTLCQGASFATSTLDWPAFSQYCPANYKDQIFPQNFVIADNASIPFWATINPTSWSSELFNVQQAFDYYGQNKSQYFPNPSPTPQSSSSGSSTNLGAIIGGSVGGAVALLLILGGGYFLCRRMRRRSTNPVPYHASSGTSTHTRWPSDPSSVLPPTSMGSSLPISYTSLHSQGSATAFTPTLYTSFSPPPTDTASFSTTFPNGGQRAHVIPMV